MLLKRYDGNASGQDFARGVALDANENVYVTGLSAGISTNLDIVTIKYDQKTPQQLQNVRNDLKMLAVGLNAVSGNSTVKNIIYQSCSLSVDEFYHIRLDSLIARAAQQSVDIKTPMNTAIADTFGLNPAKDHVDKILKGLKYFNSKLIAFVAVPHFPTFDSTEQAQNPLVGYSFLDQNYPIACVNCPDELVTLQESEFTPFWIVTPHVPGWFMFNTVVPPAPVPIYPCTFQTYSTPCDNCQVCPPATGLGGVGEQPGGNFINHEIRIDIGANGDDFNLLDEDVTIGPCYDNKTATPVVAKNCATLRVIPNSVFYNRIVDAANTSYRKVYKEIYPIKDRFAFTGVPEGNILNLCPNENRFNSIDENPGEQYALAFGGIYKLHRPGINQQPVYFAYPFAHWMWFTQGPDMGIYYGIDQPLTSCPSCRQEILQDYYAWGELIDQSEITFGLSSQAITDILVTTDENAIKNYWFDNAINICFTSLGGSGCKNNQLEFIANNLANTCIPSINASFPNPIVSLILNSSGHYEVENTFLPIYGPYQPGTGLLVYVRANYANGETINECQQITLTDPNPFFDFNTITVQLRGDLRDYQPPPVVNYQIDVYKIF